MNQKVALRLLERLGYSADVVPNGLEVLAALERVPYDVVLMDVQMPELDGLDTTRRICEQWPPETPAPHHRHDGKCAARGSRGLLRGRHGRLRGEADPSGRAGGRAAPGSSAPRASDGGFGESDIALEAAP